MFESNKKFERTIHNYAADNLYSTLDAELKRMHRLLEAHGNNENNMGIFWKRINLLQDCLIKAAEKGMDEDLQKEIKQLKNDVADAILTGTK